MSQGLLKWHRELATFSQIKRAVILEGNINDTFAFPGSGRDRIQYYLGYFFADDYDCVMMYDTLNGVTDPRRDLAQSEEKMSDEEKAQEAEWEERVQGVIEEAGEDSKIDLNDAGVSLNAFCEKLPYLLRQGGKRVMVILNLASRYTARPDNLSQRDVEAFTQLQQAIAGAISGNFVVLITNKQNDLPSWFFLDNPCIKTIHVDLPTAEERRAFVEGNALSAFFKDDIYEQDIQAYQDRPDELTELINRFVSRTEGMTNIEMVDLSYLCRSLNLRVPQLCSVIDWYLYGIRENPWENEGLRERVRKGEKVLTDKVKGQPAAIRAVMDVVKRSIVGMSGIQHKSGGKPKGILFFAGPTGTGKTETAKAIAELIFGDAIQNEKTFIRFDMSEYSQSHSDQRLLGAPPGYVGYEAGGQLTNAVRKNPFCVLLFDEIEKAAPSILDKFLQILEDGRMTDGQGHTVYFSESILIFTSNLGIRNRRQQVGARNGRQHVQQRDNVTMDMPYEEVSSRIRAAIDQYFKKELGRPEILNRIGENIIVFDFIRPEIAAEILSMQLQAIQHGLQENKRIRLEWDSKAESQLLQRAKQNLGNGGRGIVNVVESAWINPLARFLFDQDVQPGSTLRVLEIDESQTPVSLVCEVTVP